MLQYLQAGCGFGGSCFPKDVKALVAYGERAQVPMRLLKAVLEINRRQPYQVIELLQKRFPTLSGVRVAVLGLAFKPNTDDMREAPALPIVRRLVEDGSIVRAYDPVAAAVARELIDPSVRFCSTVAETIEDADAVVVLTPWPEFANLPMTLARRPNPPLLVDGRRSYERTAFSRYEGIGLNHRHGGGDDHSAPVPVPAAAV
jgi:UDPglucose 6-dehydrogenase/GDP-mannose 6-dehydrogenase